MTENTSPKPGMMTGAEVRERERDDELRRLALEQAAKLAAALSANGNTVKIYANTFYGFLTSEKAAK